ncbi:thiol-activated cytolysin family protein [Clostridiaceae bacterium M8S5]|nr:thiol-activated cytolysin family protein [Clostridiaceae bacterium M8S5]
MLKMKSSKVKKIVMGMVLSICVGAQPALAVAEPVVTATETQNSVDKGIANLDYNKYEVLANQGDVIENVVPKEGLSENGKFIVLEHTKKSLGGDPVDISVVDSIMDRTYPGALLLADGEFVKNRPTALMAERKPINISIDLPGLEDDNTILVENPSYGTVNGAIQKLIDRWAAKNSETHTLPARTQYTETMVHSKNQLKMGLNVDIDLVDKKLGIDFGAIMKGEEKCMVASYKQIFYTVSAQLPNNPSDLFGSDVTFKELQGKGVSDNSPPVMVSNVAYGRTVYVVLKTSSSSNKVEATFKALLKGQSIKGNTEFENIAENSSFSVVVLGGDAQEHNKLITTDFNEVRNIIKDNAAFSLKNPGYPISYTSSFLKDNSLAAVHNSTDYVETTSTQYSRGKISIDHSGGYVARFFVSWDEVSYDDKGNEKLTHKNWDGNAYVRTAHYTTVIDLPANAKNINIYAHEATFVLWEPWRVILDEKNLPLTNNIQVAVWGTTLFPAHSVKLV